MQYLGSGAIPHMRTVPRNRWELAPVTVHTAAKPWQTGGLAFLRESAQAAQHAQHLPAPLPLGKFAALCVYFHFLQSDQQVQRLQ